MPDNIKGKYSFNNLLKDIEDNVETLTPEQIYEEMRQLRKEKNSNLSLIGKSPESSEYDDLDNPQTLDYIRQMAESAKKLKARGSIPASQQIQNASVPDAGKLTRKGVQWLTSLGSGALAGSPGGLPGMAAGAAINGIGTGLFGADDPDIISGENVSNALGPFVNKAASAFKPFQKIAQGSPIIGNMLKGGAEQLAVGAAGQAADKNFDPQALFYQTLLGGAGQGLTTGMLARGAKNSGILGVEDYMKKNPYTQGKVEDMLEPLARSSEAADIGISAAQKRIAENNKLVPKMEDEYMRMSQSIPAERGPKGQFLKKAELDARNKHISDMQALRDRIDKIGPNNKTIEDQVYSWWGNKQAKGMNPVVDDAAARKLFQDPNRLKVFVEKKLDNLLKEGEKGFKNSAGQSHAVNEMKKMVEFGRDVHGNDRPMQEAITTTFLRAFEPTMKGDRSDNAVKAMSPVLRKAMEEVFPNRPEAFSDLMKISGDVDKITKALNAKATGTTGSGFTWRANIRDLMDIITPQDVVDRILAGRSHLNELGDMVSQVRRLAEQPLAGGDMIQTVIRNFANAQRVPATREKKRQESDQNVINIGRSLGLNN